MKPSETTLAEALEGERETVYDRAVVDPGDLLLSAKQADALIAWVRENEPYQEPFTTGFFEPHIKRGMRWRCQSCGVRSYGEAAEHAPDCAFATFARTIIGDMP